MDKVQKEFSLIRTWPRCPIFAKCKSLMSDKLKTYPSQPRAFHKEPFATHPWISWWLGCMRVLAARLSPLHFLRPGWLKGNVNSALFPKGMLLTTNHPPGWTRHAPSSLKEKCLLTKEVLRTYPTHSLSFHTEPCDHLYFIVMTHKSKELLYL